MIYCKAESYTRKRMQRVQLENIQETVKRVYSLVPFYKEKFDDLGINPKDIESLDDIRKLPFTKKQDLRNNYPYGLFAVDMDEIVRIHSSSGTTGKPTVVGYTAKDMNIWSEVMARIFYMGGVNSSDILHNAIGYGLFTGGLGFHEAAQRMKVAVIPSSTGFTSRQLLLMKDFKATVLNTTPSFALHMAETAKKEGYNLKKDLQLKCGFYGGEPASKGLKDEIKDIWGIPFYEVYGLSEIIGPGVAGGCKHSDRLHINEDHFYPEILDPDTLEPVKEGERGELVLTTITKQGLPIIRYRTGDITSLDFTPCRCGRTTVKMESVVGRSDDMIIVGGVNIFPSQIEHVLSNIEGVSLNYQIILDKKGYLDKLELDVELTDNMMSDSVNELQKLKAEIQKDILNNLYIHAEIKLVQPNSIQRSAGKAVRIIDKRK
ncbi:phenylacetate--CoA ligase family protein [Arcobacter sp. LA11]|uniref:phenylacetate--CoA ligase family protein n=1 Tax=Arcobacter sp. LA11 TaxID=1898176 RepID=UPI0009321494|nr:phenylacetate--CoA ligase [Arcobacter sp. LA11]